MIKANNFPPFLINRLTMSLHRLGVLEMGELITATVRMKRYFINNGVEEEKCII